MRAAWVFAYNLIDGAIPNGLSLYLLGAGLLAAAAAQVSIAFVPIAYDSPDILQILALLLAGLGNTALAAVATVNALRRSSALAARMRGDRPPTIAFRFFHVAVAACVATVLPSLLPALQALLNGGNEAMFMELLLLLTWTPLAGAALVLALLSRLRWDARFAVLGAVVSIAVFGCAVGFAPTIYGRDLQPMGWYAILVSFIPVLGFLAVFLRRAPVFSASRWRRGGLAAALFLALAFALGLQMEVNPFERFTPNLRAALDSGAPEIRFSDLTDFEWDEVEIYDPYSTERSLSPAARAGTDMISRSYFGVNGHHDFLVFIKGGDVVHYEVVWRENYSIKYPDDPGAWSVKHEDAVFEVEYRPSGYRRLTLKD